MQSKNFVGRGTKDIKSSLEKVQNEESILCGSFRSTFSNLGSTYFLWRHANFDAAETLRMIWLSNQGMYMMLYMYSIFVLTIIHFTSFAKEFKYLFLYFRSKP